MKKKLAGERQVRQRSSAVRQIHAVSVTLRVRCRIGSLARHLHPLFNNPKVRQAVLKAGRRAREAVAVSITPVPLPN